ncbi:hypothetical protein SAMN05421754_100261 [Nitrosomonas sp. Nm58]|nr:hypothetical protein SAMN05421754_100261 [Nitrosomonas sp. Nm58]
MNNRRLGRNFPKGVTVDTMNINLRKVLRQLALLCTRFEISFNQLLVSNMLNPQLNS